MRYLLVLLCIISLSAVAQEFKHEKRAKRLFASKLKSSDFRKGVVFLTLDTTNMSDINVPSTFLQTTDPKKIIKNYKKFMKSIKLDGPYFNYHELVNSPFYESPLNISYIMNTKDASYLVKIWTDKNNIDKIEGITVGKYSAKLKRL